jgi:hypothetical protein
MLMSECRVGNRVKIHPGTDAFMLGFRYGEIVKVGRKWVHVETSAIRGAGVIEKTMQFTPQYLLPMELSD